MIFKIGDKITEKKIFTPEMVEDFAKLTGDYNPIHFDENYTLNTIFRQPIVHGPLVLTLITTMFANVMPGNGAVYLSHDLKFTYPVYYNDEISAQLTIVEITQKKHFIIKTTALNQNGIVVIDGVARLKLL